MRSAAGAPKPAFPLDKCFAIIQEGSGTHFDPQIVEAFLACREAIVEVRIEYEISNRQSGSTTTTVGLSSDRVLVCPSCFFHWRLSWPSRSAFLAGFLLGLRQRVLGPRTRNEAHPQSHDIRAEEPSHSTTPETATPPSEPPPQLFGSNCHPRSLLQMARS